MRVRMFMRVVGVWRVILCGHGDMRATHPWVNWLDRDCPSSTPGVLLRCWGTFVAIFSSLAGMA